jgi:arsenite-transporting ATPase
MVGVSALRGLLTSQPETASFAEVSALQKPAISSLSALVDEIALNEHGLIMLMGKGGVGKTTMAAAIAVRLAEMGFDVHLTTSDPAAHLSTTLNGSLNNLQVSRIDPHEKQNVIASMSLKRKDVTWMKQGNICWKRIYALRVPKRLLCSRPSHG